MSPEEENPQFPQIDELKSSLKKMGVEAHTAHRRKGLLGQKWHEGAGGGDANEAKTYQEGDVVGSANEEYDLVHTHRKTNLWSKGVQVEHRLKNPKS